MKIEQKIHTDTHAHRPTHSPVPELVAKRRDFSYHALTAVGELLQFPLQLPPLGVGATVLLLHLFQLPLQLLHAHQRLIHLEKEGRGRGKGRNTLRQV